MDNYTIDLILWKHNKNKDGLCPIYIRVTINRKTSYKATGHFTDEKMWDSKNEKLKSSYSNYAMVNARLSNLKKEWESKLIGSQIKGVELSAKQLKTSFKTDHNDLFVYVEELIKRNKKSAGTYENYRKHLRKLKEYVGGDTLSFETIDVHFLSQYEMWLRNTINFRKTDSQKNYIHAIWKTLKTWFSTARREGIISHYPFDQYENPVYVSPDKDFLTLRELEEMEKFADETIDPVLKEVAVYFLFGCFAGFRISDWYQFDPAKHIKGDKIRLRPAKTKNKWVEMIISKPLARNLERMKKVPLTLAEPTINEKLKVIGKKIGINKHLSSHRGRGTFAITICLGNKLSSETAAQLMGISLQTFVANYSKITQEKIDNETKEAWKNLN